MKASRHFLSQNRRLSPPPPRRFHSARTITSSLLSIRKATIHSLFLLHPPVERAFELFDDFSDKRAFFVSLASFFFLFCFFFPYPAAFNRCLQRNEKWLIASNFLSEMSPPQPRRTAPLFFSRIVSKNLLCSTTSLARRKWRKLEAKKKDDPAPGNGRLGRGKKFCANFYEREFFWESRDIV